MTASAGAPRPEIPMDDRPLPVVDAVSAPFWEGTRAGVLRVQRCTTCGTTQWYPRAICVTDGGDVEWIDCAGTGTVHTYTVIRQNHARPFRDQLPYVVALVDLPEGVRMLGNVVGCDPESVHIGMAVAVHLAPSGGDDDLWLPFWVPAAG